MYALCDQNGLLVELEPEPEPVVEQDDSVELPVNEAVEDLDVPTLDMDIDKVALTLDDVPNLSDAIIEQMQAEGITDPRTLQDLTLEQLTQFKGIGQVTGQEILDWLKETYG